MKNISQTPRYRLRHGARSKEPTQRQNVWGKLATTKSGQVALRVVEKHGTRPTDWLRFVCCCIAVDQTTDKTSFCVAPGGTVKIVGGGSISGSIFLLSTLDVSHQITASLLYSLAYEHVSFWFFFNTAVQEVSKMVSN